jgi:predicted nucleotidyltransferase component of viral defense system
MFMRDLPRLSVDIDLTYLPVADRAESLKAIAQTLEKIGTKLLRTIPGVRVARVVPKGGSDASGLVVTTREAQIKVEVNTVIRGSVFPAIDLDLCERAQEEFSAEVSMQTLSKADVFGGKICAALDRQHPRDLFDIMILLQEDGITQEVQRSFVIYLASHDRPMSEILAPTWKDLSKVYETDFRGMTLDDVPLSRLLEARTQLLEKIKANLLDEEKHFLLSIKRGEPEWQLLGIPGINLLPAIQWKLLNIRKMSSAKRELAYQKLEATLF